MRLLDRLLDAAERLPSWAQPAFGGALLLAAIVSVRLVFALPAIFSDPGAVAMALVAVFVASLGGAAGGLAYSFLGRPLLRVPRVGPYLTGIVTVAGYMGVLGLLIPFLDPEAPSFFADLPGRIIFAFCVLLFGILIGRSWFSGPSALEQPVPQQRVDHAVRKRKRKRETKATR